MIDLLRTSARLPDCDYQIHVVGEDTLIPDDYHSIPFHSWLDVFLQYALLLAQNGDVESSYELVATASHGNVFYHSPDSMFLIHVCWFSKYRWSSHRQLKRLIGM